MAHAHPVPRSTPAPPQPLISQPSPSLSQFFPACFLHHAFPESRHSLNPRLPFLALLLCASGASCFCWSGRRLLLLLLMLLLLFPSVCCWLIASHFPNLETIHLPKGKAIITSLRYLTVEYLSDALVFFFSIFFFDFFSSFLIPLCSLHFPLSPHPP